MRNPWLPNQPSPDQPGIRLFCFHYAGGSAGIFSNWYSELRGIASVYTVQLPGRWERFNEPRFLTMEPLVQALNEGISAEAKAPYAVLGYSLGCLIGFEWIRSLRKQGRPMPQHFFALARSAPHLKGLHGPASQLPDQEFLEHMQNFYGNIPEEMKHNEELRELFLPVIKADMSIIDHYICREEPKLDIPITAMRGIEDRSVSAERLEAWREMTSGPFLPVDFTGGHFFTQNSEREVLELIKSQLTA